MKDPLSYNEMHRLCHPCVTSTTHKESGADTAVGAAKRDCPPPYTDVDEHFGGLEEVAERCRMTEVSYHLHKAKLAWMGKIGPRKTKQTCIADFV